MVDGAETAEGEGTDAEARCGGGVDVDNDQLRVEGGVDEHSAEVSEVVGGRERSVAQVHGLTAHELEGLLHCLP